MKILAFLQNQWFREPDRIKKLYDLKPLRRRDLNRAFLFAGCLSGRRLRAAFGDLCREIEWEEVSLEIGGQASAAFPPDHEHIKKVIEDVQPDYLIVFGEIARKALESHALNIPRITCPHPAARGKDIPLRLAAAAKSLREAEMALKPAANMDKPVIEIRHADLERFGDSIYKSKCPSCKTGFLPVRRDPETLALLDVDTCLFCAQKFRYTDAAKAFADRP